jgi:hypothetical protein
MRRLRWVCWLLALAVLGEERVNRHSAILADFQNRIDSYLKLRKQAEAGLPPLKTTESPQTISEHERALAENIRQLRRDAKRGEVFTPSIAAEFRRLVKIASSRGDAPKIRASLSHSEPVHLAIRVNDPYPASVPLQTMPPTLVANLPALPPQLEYRVIGHKLILRDIGANLVIDFANGVIP